MVHDDNRTFRIWNLFVQFLIYRRLRMNTSRMKFVHEMIPNARHIILPRNCNEHVNLTINKHPSTDNNDIIRSGRQVARGSGVKLKRGSLLLLMYRFRHTT